jgi:hypothetical protein
VSEEIRKVASALYNQAYEVYEAGDNPLMAVELAGTSLNLWRQIGNHQNLSIGNWLYSRALLQGGAIDLALMAIENALEHLEEIEEPADWLVASALEGYARALNAAGVPEAVAAIDKAAEAISAIADPEDRALIASQFADLRQA